MLKFERITCKMRLIAFSLLIPFMYVEGIAREETRKGDHHRLIERLEALEEQQRESRSRIEALENTVKSQARVIKSQSREIEGFEFIVLKHIQHAQYAYRQTRLNRRKILAMQKVLMEAGLLDKKKVIKTETTTQPAVATLGDDKQNNQNLFNRKDERSETMHEGQSSMAKRHPSTLVGAVSRRQERAGISFSVYLDHDVDFGAHQTIKFNQIITNEGDGYNQHSGVFTCPEAGVYLFSFFIGQRGEAVPKGIAAELMVNSVNILDAIVDSHSPGQDITGGNTAVIRLNQGDTVWIDSLGNNGHAEGSPGLKLTSFSGVFLYP